MSRVITGRKTMHCSRARQCGGVSHAEPQEQVTGQCVYIVCPLSHGVRSLQTLKMHQWEGCILYMLCTYTHVTS